MVVSKLKLVPYMAQLVAPPEVRLYEDLGLEVETSLNNTLILVVSE